MSQVWEKELTHSEQSILLAMADWADDEGRRCYPSHERLAWKTGYSERQVARIIKELVGKGILVIVRPPTQHNSAHYRIRLDKAKDKPPYRASTLSPTDDSRDDNLSTLDDSRDDKCAQQGGHLEHPGMTNAPSRVDMVSPDPLSDPLKETISNNHHNSGSSSRSFSFEKAIDTYKANIQKDAKAVPKAVQDSIRQWCNDIGEDTVIEAIEEAALQNARTWNYVVAKLKAWKEVEVTKACSLKELLYAVTTNRETGEEIYWDLQGNRIDNLEEWVEIQRTAAAAIPAKRERLTGRKAIKHLV